MGRLSFSSWRPKRYFVAAGSNALVVLLLLLSLAAARYYSHHPPASVRLQARTSEQAEEECENIGSIPREQQCAFAQANCSSLAGLGGNYFTIYYCTFGNARALGILLLVCVMLYSFLMLATAAGDYLCPNLSSLSHWLHLSQSVAGVTLAALGNGAPDIISTFSAMTADTAGLAIGELLGAAMFVTFVVVGVIAMVSPFKLPRRPFIRDIVAFIGALILVLVICSDKKITQAEGWLLVAYYLAYVSVVVIGAYVYQRSKAARLARETDRDVVGGDDDEIDDDDDDSRRPFFETEPLLGAVDDALQHDPRKPPIYDEAGFDSDFFLPNFIKFPVARRSQHLLLPGGGFYSRSLTTPTPTPTHSAFGGRINHPRILLRRSTAEAAASFSTSAPAGPSPLSPPRLQRIGESPGHESPLPSVVVPMGRGLEGDDDDDRSVFSDAENTAPPPVVAVEASSLVSADLWRPVRTRLLPSYARWRHLTLVERIQAVIQSPIYLVFSLTTPVVHAEEMDLYNRREKHKALRRSESLDSVAYTDPDAGLDDGSAGDLTSDSEFGADDEPGLKNVDPYLTVMQLTIAPLFVSLALDNVTDKVGNSSMPMWALCVVLGLVLGVGAYTVTRRHAVIKFGRIMAVAGFIVAVTWVYIVASEAVAVLTAVASVLGISSTIMGMTLFAFGNSVGDLMTNISIAQMGYPAMAVGACFGSPMLNLVLGIGVTSTYLTTSRGTPYMIDQSLTPVYACAGSLIAGLTAALIYIPYQNFKATAAFGAAAVGAYVVLMAGILVLSHVVA
ncbi:hypothetical protein HDU87_006330 [Geranomyces variabilis]|uniref:Sodium/calcium exchanger membrane region domain-containing protein n=1 Tax=Geranomyces variabilis TaxID=109894 RepID=A0AAD5XL46_9FUNG|nr:hypothetical protein HDU87_006330 [Geranomyces variabilis]